MKDLEKAVVSVLLGEKKHLTAKQQKIDVHEPEKDELTAKDFEMLRAGKKAKNEEVEVIDEISKGLAARAYHKMANDGNDMKGRTGLAGDQSDRLRARMNKRWGEKAATRAINKADKANEEVEVIDEDQLEELKKSTLQSYIKTAASQAHRAYQADLMGKPRPAGIKDKNRGAMTARAAEKMHMKMEEVDLEEDQLRMIEQVIEFLLDEGWDDMLKAAQARSAPQPSGGSGVKQGTRYGGSRQKDTEEDEPKQPRMKSGARHGIKRRAKTNESQEHSFNEYLTAAIAKHGTTAEAVQIANEAFNNNDTSLLSNDTEA